MDPETSRFELPDRDIYALPHEVGFWYHPDALRHIADEFKFPKRDRFYALAQDLAHDYFNDKLIEEDLRVAPEARTRFQKCMRQSVRLAFDISEIMGSRELFSLWTQPCFRSRDLDNIASGFRRDELANQLVQFAILTYNALNHLPTFSSGRKKYLALRKWTEGHLKFWEKEIGRKITNSHDHRDGKSETHRFLCAVLEPIDRESTGQLTTILRDWEPTVRPESQTE